MDLKVFLRKRLIEHVYKYQIFEILLKHGVDEFKFHQDPIRILFEFIVSMIHASTYSVLKERY